MPRHCIVQFALGLLLGILVVPEVRGAATLVKNGQPQAAIFVSARVWDDPAKTPESPAGHKSLKAEDQRRRLRESVRDLAGILQRISGAKIEIVIGLPRAGDSRLPLLIGELAEQKFGKVKKSYPHRQGLRIVVQPGAVGLWGESDLGSSYAIYTLLDQLGCRWYMPSLQGEVLPALPTMTLDDRDVSDGPFTEFRDIWYCDAEYARRNRMGGFIINAGHALEFTITKEQRQKHPEIRGIIGGQPNDHRLKWTHPLVAQFISEAILKQLQQDPETTSFSLSPDDGISWDESDDAKYDAGDFDPSAATVSKTDRLMVLTNRVAQAVSAKYPHVKFGMLAYVDYTRPPVREPVHAAIVPQIAPITFSRAHPMNDLNEPNNRMLQYLVNGWAKLSPATSYYFYAYNLAETASPNPMLAKWGHDVPYALGAGKCRYWQPETIANFETSLHALYMSNRLAWNPEQKPADIYDEINTRFYGHAARPMTAYWQVIDDCWTKTPEYSGCGFGHVRRFTPERMAQARSLMNQAVQACQTEVEKLRVGMAEASLSELELFMKLRHDLADGRFSTLAGDAQRYVETMNKLGEKYRPQFAFFRLGWTSDVGLSVRYFMEFYKHTYDDATRLARDFKLLTPALLRQWKYQRDKNKTGEAAGWSKPDFDDAAWKTTDVAAETWSTLGYHNDMGMMWYRTRIAVPAVPAGKKVFLWLGATDGRAKLFVNGRPISYVDPQGKSADSFSSYCHPASFDITSAVQSGKENQISILCTREFLNELGTGGLIAPAALYCEK